MIRLVDQFYLDQEEPNRACLLALRGIILEQDPLVSESVKWGMPCFSYKKRMFAFLWTDKKTGEPYILLVEGKHLDHPALETGDRVRMKILRINPNEDLALDTIIQVLDDALDLYRKGLIKSRLY